MKRPNEARPPGRPGRRQEGGGVVSNIKRFTRQGEDARESGQALVEYTLILMLIAFVAFGTLEVLGTSVTGALGDAAAGFGGA